MLKGTVQKNNLIPPKVVHSSCIDFWNKSVLTKQKSEEQSMKAPRICRANLPCKFMHQSRLYPTKLESNAYFAPQEHGYIVSRTKKKKKYVHFWERIFFGYFVIYFYFRTLYHQYDHLKKNVHFGTNNEINCLGVISSLIGKPVLSNCSNKAFWASTA